MRQQKLGDLPFIDVRTFARRSPLPWSQTRHKKSRQVKTMEQGLIERSVTVLGTRSNSNAG